MKNAEQIEVAMIGKSIKTLRRANNLTQEELANKCGYSVRNLRRIENYGTTSIEVINTFALIFKVRAIDILNGCFIFTKKLATDQFYCKFTPIYNPSKEQTIPNFFIHFLP